MDKINDFIKNLSLVQKIISLIVIFVLIIILVITIPTFSKYKHRNGIENISAWDGSIATSYRSGTGSQSDPYIIANASELAYFIEQTNTNSYTGVYFKLGNSIVVNDGIFSYVSDVINYTNADDTYHLNNYSNELLNESEAVVGTINSLNSINNFKGTFDGDYYTIYGLYINHSTNDNVGLFTSLEGTVKNIYVENTFIMGGKQTALISNSNNSTIKDILFDGFVIGRDNNLETSETLNISDSPIYCDELNNTDTINVTERLTYTESEILSSSLTGSYTIDGATDSDVTITLNGNAISGGTFDIDMATAFDSDLDIVIDTTITDITITFTNLNYNLNTRYGLSGGIVGNAINSNITNTINAGYIKGYSTSGGIIGLNKSSSLTRSYNNGEVVSNVAGGLIGTIANSNVDVNINNCYNEGTITSSNIGALIGKINNNINEVNINNSFNIVDTYLINSIGANTVNVTNVYSINSNFINTGIVTGSFITSTTTLLNSKTYLTTNVNFNEYIDDNDLANYSTHAWMFEDDETPILYFDTLRNPIAELNVNTYSWNNLSYNLESIDLTDSVTFSISETDVLNPLSEVYYYVHRSNIPLTNSEIMNLTWIPYTEIVSSIDEGYYIVYAKAVDYNNVTSYITSDLLVLDREGVQAKVNYNSLEFDDFRTSLDSSYIDGDTEVTINVNQTVSVVNLVEYYITDTIVNDASTITEWNTYDTSVTVNTLGNNIVYFKVTDSNNFINYFNTDIITYNGYVQNDITVGDNKTAVVNDSTISKKSMITSNYTYNKLVDLSLDNYTHNVVSNILLPIGTKITIKDNNENKYYSYKIETSDDIFGFGTNGIARYAFTLFSELGTNNKLYTENLTKLNDNEDYDITLDFSGSTITSDINNINVKLEYISSSKEVVRPTLSSSLLSFNISNTESNISLSTSYVDTIDLTSGTTTIVDLNSVINEPSSIYDTKYENMNTGIMIKVLDSNSDIVTKDNLKNIIFELDGTIYSPNNDNIIRIKLTDDISDINTNLTITSDDSNSLATGTYTLVVTNYVSYDGLYEIELGNDVNLSMIVNDSIDNNPNFNVTMDDSYQVISENENITFNILRNGYFIDPEIKISLYEKQDLTAFNQIYNKVDLQNYVSGSLTLLDDLNYLVSNINGDINENFVINLEKTNLNKTGYKFVFELYDQDIKVSTIEKYFIVK